MGHAMSEPGPATRGTLDVSARRGTLKAPTVAAAEPLPGDDFYLVSGNAVTAMRNGKAVVLAGTELKRARRWVTDRAVTTLPQRKRSR